MKKELEAFLLSVRGHQQAELALGTVKKMTEEEAGEWIQLLKNLKKDAEDSGVAASELRWANRHLEILRQGNR